MPACLYPLTVRVVTLRWAAVAGVLAVLPGCGTFDRATAAVASVVTPYKVDIVQGNVVTREQVAALKPGMPRLQVRDILGTALLTSVFHADRWDYVFTLKRAGVPGEPRRVTVHFRNDVLERVDAEDLPTEAEFVATLQAEVPSSRKPRLEASPENLAAFPAPARPATPATPLPPLPAQYPPLEPPER